MSKIEEARNKVKEANKTKFTANRLSVHIALKLNEKERMAMSEETNSPIMGGFDGLEFYIGNEFSFMSDKDAKRLRDYLINLYGLPEEK